MSAPQSENRFAVYTAFGLVYFFWGSTYLAIDLAVAKIPPALMCGIRFTIAGVFMLGFCALRGRKVIYKLQPLVKLALIGILLLVGGNLTLSYAETHIPSGLAALLVAAVPLWILILDMLLLGDHRVSLRGKAGLALGVVGLAVLLWPQLMASTHLQRQQLRSSLSLLGGSMSWALGSVLARKWKSPEVDPFSATAWEIIAAGVVSLAIALAIGDPVRARPDFQSIVAMAYLVVCGSWIGYTAYIYLLNHVPTSKVSTYAYVNPVVAVFLGWAILHEPITSYILAGSAIVVASVVLVTGAEVSHQPTQKDLSLSAASD